VSKGGPSFKFIHRSWAARRPVIRRGCKIYTGKGTDARSSPFKSQHYKKNNLSARKRFYMSFCPLKGPQENGYASYLPPLIKLVVFIGSYAFAPYGRFNLAQERERENTSWNFILFYFYVRNSKMLTHDSHIKIQIDFQLCVYGFDVFQVCFLLENILIFF